MPGVTGPQAELGPQLPSRFEVYRKANEAKRLLQVAIECSGGGREEDLPRALRKLDAARAVLGPATDAGTRQED